MSKFGDAFNEAWKAGKSTFTFNGKEYTTERADGKKPPKSESGMRPKAKPTAPFTSPRPKAKPGKPAGRDRGEEAGPAKAAPKPVSRPVSPTPKPTAKAASKPVSSADRHVNDDRPKKRPYEAKVGASTVSTVGKSSRGVPFVARKY